MAIDKKTDAMKWVKQFADASAMLSYVTLKGGSSGRYNRLVKEALEKLGAMGDPGREALATLLGHERPDVRVAAASHLLRYLTAEATAVLREEAARGPSLTAFDAEQVLMRWEEGNWNLDLPDGPSAEQSGVQQGISDQNRLLRIGDITLADIRVGKRWRWNPPPDRPVGMPMPEWGPLTETKYFTGDDWIVYSGLAVYPTGEVRAMVQVKIVCDSSYGGDCCEFVDGQWQQVGLVPNPDARFRKEFFASPLSSDPSFVDDDIRDEHRQGFLRHVGKI
jgi:hypothetical protein